MSPLVLIAVKRMLVRYARPILRAELGKERGGEILNRIIKSKTRTSVETTTAGGTLMVHCAALTVMLYRELIAEGLSDIAAREMTARVTAEVYKRMGKIPWWIAQLMRRRPATRLRFATDVFRYFPFSPPDYVMEDVRSDEDTVAFDVKRCPTAEHFAHEGLPKLCQATFCNLDFDLAERWGASLERTTALARGESRCDFRWHVRVAPSVTGEQQKGGKTQ